MGNVIRNLVAIALGIALLAAPLAIVRASYEIAFVGAAPQIEQLRADLDGVSGAASEDVLGQATEWNQRIRRMQAYNSRWWADPFIPDAWDRVRLIDVAGRT